MNMTFAEKILAKYAGKNRFSGQIVTVNQIIC
jgi:hypothetical protein